MAGRPSNRDERYEQVMQALVRCVARYGLEGASLTQIASEAGLTRPLVRHHLGNREEIIAALQAYVLQSFDEQSKSLVSSLPAERAGEALIELLFDETSASSPEMVLAFAALTARASDDPELRAACRQSLLTYETAILGVLRREHPQADDQTVVTVAHGISALYLNVASLAPLDMPKAWTAKARGLAQQLLNDLEVEI